MNHTIWLTITEVATIAKVKPVTVRRWIALGYLTRNRNGKINARDWMEFEDQRRADPRRVAMLDLRNRRSDRVAFQKWQRYARSASTCTARLDGTDGKPEMSTGTTESG